jgi:hypothetical protein
MDTDEHGFNPAAKEHREKGGARLLTSRNLFTAKSVKPAKILDR